MHLHDLLDVSGENMDACVLDRSLGDRRLYECHRVFRNLRDLALLFGYRYYDFCDNLWYLYQVCPLLSLSRILEERRIPYVDNVGVVRWLCGKHSDVQMSQEFVLRSLKRNYTLHESAHAVAHVVLGTSRAMARDLTPPEQFVVSSIVSEAFANTVERVGFALVLSRLDFVLYSLNTHIVYREHHMQVLRECLEECGFRDVFRFGYILHFFSNWQAEALSDRETEAFAEAITGGNSQARERLLKLAGAGFCVNPSFRGDTTPAYFAAHRCGEEFSHLKLKARVLAETIGLHNWAEMFADLAELGPASTCASSFPDLAQSRSAIPGGDIS